MKPAHSLESVERAARGLVPTSVLVHYIDRDEPVRYAWSDRAKVRWNQVRRVRVDTAKPRQRYVGNGDCAAIPGRRVRGKS